MERASWSTRSWVSSVEGQTTSQKVLLPLDCSDEEIFAFAQCWTERLVAEDYVGAWEMLLHRDGEVWAPNAELLRARIVHYGSREPIPGEPTCMVTPIAT